MYESVVVFDAKSGKQVLVFRPKNGDQNPRRHPKLKVGCLYVAFIGKKGVKTNLEVFTNLNAIKKEFSQHRLDRGPNRGLVKGGIKLYFAKF